MYVWCGATTQRLFLENAALLKSESILLCYYHIVSITPPTFTLGLIAVIIMRGKRFYPKKVPGPEHIYTHTYTSRHLKSTLSFWNFESELALFALGRTLHTAHFTASAFSRFSSPCLHLFFLSLRSWGNPSATAAMATWLIGVIPLIGLESINKSRTNTNNTHTHYITAVTFDLYMI